MAQIGYMALGSKMCDGVFDVAPFGRISAFSGLVIWISSSMRTVSWLHSYTVSRLAIGTESVV